MILHFIHGSAWTPTRFWGRTEVDENDIERINRLREYGWVEDISKRPKEENNNI